jgi:hypothetical protein
MGPGAELLGGEFEEWKITAVGGLDSLVLAVLALAAIAALVWTWRSLDPRLGLGRRIAIGLLRAAALVLALGLLLQPTLRFRKLKAAPARLAFVVDASKSMARGDEESRLGEVAGLLGDARARLEELSRHYRVSWYRFADELERVGGPEQATTPIGGASGTDVRTALTTLAEARSDDPLIGIVLLGDGADTELDAEAEQPLEWAADLKVPVNTVATTRAGRQQDLSITAARVDPFAFSRSETPIAVSVKSIGLTEQQVEVTLWQDGSVMQRREVSLVGGEGKTTFTALPSRLGRHVLSLTVPVPEGDEVPENNTAHVAFDVIRDKFRVLHLAGRPSWDQRYLREFLTSWPRIDLVSFYILRTPYQSSVLGSGGLALIPFPTEGLFEQHLDEFDIVVFHDFDPAEVGVDRYLEKIASFVEGGGALVVIGAAKGFGAGVIAKKPIAGLLPLRLLPAGTPASKLAEPAPFRARLTEAGERHPLMRLVAEPRDNVERWASLSRLDGLVRVAQINDDGIALAEHPTARVDDGPAPVIAVKEAGKGRTMAITTDSLWRWRFSAPMGGGPADVYPELWRRAIAWLTRDPELDRLRVDVRPWTVEPEQEVEIAISLVDESYRPQPGEVLECAISWLDEAGVERIDAFSARLDEEGGYRREWLPRAPGPHRIRVSGVDVPTRTDRFLVREAEAEIKRLDPDEELLQALAKATGGHHSSGALELSKLELLDTPARVEWILRRRSGLT